MRLNHTLWVKNNLPPQLEKNPSFCQIDHQSAFWLCQRAYQNESEPFHRLCLALDQACPDQKQMQRNELQVDDKDVKQRNTITRTFHKTLVRQNVFFSRSQIITHWFTSEHYLILSAPNDSSYFVILMILYISLVWWVNHCLSEFTASISFIVFCLPSAVQGDVNFALLTFLTPLGRLSWRIKLLTNQQPTRQTPSCTSSSRMWEPANSGAVQNQECSTT